MWRAAAPDRECVSPAAPLGHTRHRSVNRLPIHGIGGPGRIGCESNHLRWRRFSSRRSPAGDRRNAVRCLSSCIGAVYRWREIARPRGGSASRCLIWVRWLTLAHAARCRPHGSPIKDQAANGPQQQAILPGGQSWTFIPVTDTGRRRTIDDVCLTPGLSRPPTWPLWAVVVRGMGHNSPNRRDYTGLSSPLRLPCRLVRN